MTLDLILHHFRTYGAFLISLRLLTGVGGAWVTYGQEVAPNGRRTFSGFARYCFPKQLFTLQSVRFDFYMFFLSRISGIWIFAAAVATTAFMAPAAYHTMAAIFGTHEQHAITVPLQIAVVLLCILMRDFGEFASHAIMHRYDFLWEFHKVHHSSLMLTPLGSKRAHFVEDFLRIIPNTAAVAICIGLFSYAFSLQFAQNTLFGIDAYALFNILSLETLRHSHIPLSFGKLERYLMSPLQHHVHHNREGAPRNFGSFLACWDRMFGSFSPSLPRGSFQIGLDPVDQARYDSLAKLYYKPFWNSGRILLSGLRGPMATTSAKLAAEPLPSQASLHDDLGVAAG